MRITQLEPIVNGQSDHYAVIVDKEELKALYDGVNYNAEDGASNHEELDFQLVKEFKKYIE